MKEKEKEKEKKKKNMNKQQYQDKQFSTFEFLETSPKMWKVAPIKEIGPTNKDIKFNIPSDYKTVTPITDQLTTILSVNKEFGLTTKDDLICELCGHWIKYPYPILCEAKKYVMWIGSECITNYTDSKPITKLIQEFELNQIQKIFNSWLDLAIKFIDEEPHYKEEGSTYRIQYNFYSYKWELMKHIRIMRNQQQPNKKPYGKRKILNIMALAFNYYKIPIPQNIKQILEQENKIIPYCSNCGTQKILSNENKYFCVVCAGPI